MASEEDIKRALNYIEEYWPKQNDELDRLTKFVYDIDNLDSILTVCNEKKIDKNFALHRWYNFNCAEYHEYLFYKNGAVKEKDKHHKTIDFYINGIAFDLKTTYFPKAIQDKTHYNLSTRTGKNNLILWLYKNQSKQARFHLENRLFIVCEDLKSKSNFDSIEQKIKVFMDYSNENGFNRIEINNKPIFSEVIWVKN